MPRKPPAELSVDQLEFIDWLVTPPRLRQVKSETDFAKVLGVGARTLGVWKQDPLFKRAWWGRVDELNVTPQRLQEVLDALHETASDPTARGQVAAAKEYMAYIDRCTPARVVEEVEEERGLDELTDAELDEAIEAIAAARGVGVDEVHL